MKKKAVFNARLLFLHFGWKRLLVVCQGRQSGKIAPVFAQKPTQSA